MKDIFEQIIELLNQDNPCVMTTILSKTGSAPREEGTKMLVKKDFSIFGTIGGGMLEALTMKLSSTVFDNKEFIIKDFVLSNKDASSTGMICGGDVKVLFEYIDCHDCQMVDIYKKASELSRDRTDFVLITKISEKNAYITGNDKWICTETGFYGNERDEVQSIAKKVREDFRQIRIHEMLVGKERFIIEPIFNFESVCIVGAGHVAQKIADLTKNLGFYTIVVDDREEFANTERFQTADEVKVLKTFYNLSDQVKIDHNSYIVIVTRGHAHDLNVLAQMLRTDAKYIGMIGSHSKREQTYKTLLNEGFTTADFERVYCPIGLNIYAQTPEEIAISITAELIKVRREPHDEK